MNEERAVRVGLQKIYIHSSEGVLDLYRARKVSLVPVVVDAPPLFIFCFVLVNSWLGSSRFFSKMASAAEQVFGAPELLEKILLHVADLDLNPTAESNTSWIYFVTSVTGLQRVDHTFRNTILGSLKLQRRRLEAAEKPGVERFFEPVHTTPNVIQMDVDPVIFGPILWLEEQIIFMLKFRGVARAQDGVLTIAFHILSKDALVAWLSDRKDESWRQVKCLTNSLGVTALRLEIESDPRWRSDKISRISDLSSTATLGELADILEDAA